jgi:hypothetical protein
VVGASETVHVDNELLRGKTVTRLEKAPLMTKYTIRNSLQHYHS